MGECLIQHPFVQTYLVLVAAVAIAVFWDRLRHPSAPEDDSPVE
jgi:hypothetical protein